jgi:hypothetical protein
MRASPTSPLFQFTNSAGQLREDTAGFLYTYWSPGRRGPNDAQELFEQMLRVLQRRGWSRILVNQVDMQPFSVAEQQWIAREWLPRAVEEGGYRHGAVLVSPNVLVRLATAYVTISVQGLPMIYRSFDTEAAATRWLAQQPGTPAG